MRNIFTDDGDQFAAASVGFLQSYGWALHTLIPGLYAPADCVFCFTVEGEGAWRVRSKYLRLVSEEDVRHGRLKVPNRATGALYKLALHPLIGERTRAGLELALLHCLQKKLGWNPTAIAA